MKEKAKEIFDKASNKVKGILKKKDKEQEILNADDALFESLEKTKKAKKKKRIIIIVSIVVVLLVGLLIGMKVLRRKVATEFAKSSEEIVSAQAECGTISTLVSGSGMLVNVDTETVSVPSGVEVTEILVEYGDTVNAGDILAVVDMSSVRTAISSLQESIDDIDSEIASAAGDSVSSAVYSTVGGRVKAVYAEKGDLVEDVMAKNGALAVLSLDGYMSGELETNALNKGDAVTVVLSDGTEKAGTVSKVIGKRATILISDDGPELGDEATVMSADSKELGTITLSINNPLAITGYAGTVSSVSAVNNKKVSSYSTLFYLTNTSTSANYDTLLRTRSEYEETLVELIKLQRNSGLVAPISGSVYSVADLDDDSDDEILDIVTISPDKQMEVSITVDESNILSIELGQTADVTVRSIGDETLVGEVTEIDKTYTSGYYTALITLDKVEGMISGMTASVDIRIEGVDDAVLIPAEALNQTSSGYYVYTSYDEETKEFGGKVDVIPGLSNSNYVEITSGLSEGDTVYYTEEEQFNPFGGSMPGGMSGFPGGSEGGGGFPGGSGGSSGSGGFSPPSGGSGGGNRPSGSGMPNFGG